MSVVLVLFGYNSGADVKTTLKNQLLTASHSSPSKSK